MQFEPLDIFAVDCYPEEELEEWYEGYEPEDRYLDTYWESLNEM
jgi:hypothetical protein